MWGIIGNESEVALLHGSISAGRWAHAYLIVGPEFAGKRALGMQFVLIVIDHAGLVISA